MFKKLLYMIRWAKYSYYKKKAHKYWYKIAAAEKNKNVKLSKLEKKYLMHDINSVYGISVYADTDSVSFLK